MDYKVITLRNQKFDIAIISMSALNPFNMLSKVEEELKTFSSKKKVLFDLFSVNGNNNRFCVLTFDGTKFDMSSYQDVDLSKQSELRNRLNQFYHENYNDIYHLSIPKSLDFLVKKGYINKY